MARKYAAEFKENIIARMLPPRSESVSSITQETGISVDTLYTWRIQNRNNMRVNSVAVSSAPRKHDSEEKLLTGSNIASCLETLASLRLEIFREYPYLYEGRHEDELCYLKSYAEAPDACVILGMESGTIAGAATGMPLIHEDPQMLEAFSKNSLAVEGFYYVGELLLYQSFRNRGLGSKLLGQMESHIRSLGKYRKLTCATVVRPEDHPARRQDYIPITRFLAHSGFVILPGVTTSFSWSENDGIRRDHPMQFWVKELS